MAHHVEARHDADENLFLPPLRTLGFNSQLRINDSLLAQSYVEAYDISYPEAIRRIESEVNELRQRIANEGKYELTDIGTLYNNEAGSYLFEPCEAGLLTPGLYGLSSFEISELASENEITVTRETTIEMPPREPEPEVPETTIEDIEEEEEDDSTIRIKIAWIRNAVAAVAAVIAFLFITTPISNSDSSYVLSSMDGNGLLQAVQGDSSAKAMSLSPEQIKKAINHSDTITRTPIDSTSKTAVSPDSVAKDKDHHAPYCIVLASQITRKNAAAYVNELHDKGFEQAYVYINNNMVRVVYGDYVDEAAAYKDLQTLRGSKYFEQAWVYKKK